jgi:hypothetical protein
LGDNPGRRLGISRSLSLSSLLCPLLFQRGVVRFISAGSSKDEEVTRTKKNEQEQ